MNIQSSLPENKRNRAQIGFTLIEMLVVITIIAMLASLITGAVQKGLEAAKSTVCRNNIQQILKAVTLYNTNHEGRFPTMKSNAYGDTWQIQLEEYIGFKANPQISTPKIFRCPAQPLKGKDYYNSVLKGDYGINRRIVNIFETSSYLKLDEIRYPTTTILISDEIGNWQRDIYYYDFDDPTETRRWRHSEGINFGFIDGHVEWMNYQMFKSRGYLDANNWRYGWRDGIKK